MLYICLCYPLLLILYDLYFAHYCVELDGQAINAHGYVPFVYYVKICNLFIFLKMENKLYEDQKINPPMQYLGAYLLV